MNAVQENASKAEKPTKSQRLFGRATPAVLLAMLLIVSAYSTLNWARGYAYLHWPDMRIGGMLDGTARQPFVSRTLVPSVYKPIAAAAESLVSPLRSMLNEADITRGMLHGFSVAHRMGSEDRAAVFLAMVWLSLVLLGVGIVAFLRSLGHVSTAPWWTAICAVLLWPLLKCEERGIYFMYDPFTPTLVLWTFIAFYSRRWVLAFSGFVASTLNRETGALLPLVASFALIPGQSVREKLSSFAGILKGKAPAKSRMAILGLLAASLLGVAIRQVSTRLVYRDAMGDALEFHLMNTTLSFHAVMSYLPRMTLVVVVYYLVGMRSWNRLGGLFQGASIMFGLQLLAGATVGVIDEVRQYGELYGVGSVLACVLVSRHPESIGAVSLRTLTRGARQADVAAGSLVALLLAWSTANHWRDSMNSHASFERVHLSERSGLSTRSPEGEPWDANGNYVFGDDRVTVFVAQSKVRLDSLEIGLDGNDEYRVSLRTDQSREEHIVSPVGAPGIRNHRFRIPDGRLNEVYVFPITGDGRYAVGHLLLNR
ncbi:MAG: hypothetical protein KA712_08540 [Myxococcales bacterium]|nr:hypothetical protein [Myxococcales bacterium]